MNLIPASLRESVAQGRERFLALQVRERWMLAGGAVAVLLFVLYAGVWKPLATAHRTRVEALASARAMAVRLEQAAVKVQGARRSGVRVDTSRSLVASVDQASKQSGLGKGPSRVQPEGDKEVKVWFEDVGFDPTVKWIADLQARYGISVQTLDVEPKDQPGSVNVRLSLVRAP